MLPIDAPPDVALAALDCPTYCAQTQMNCTGANTQYLDTDHCMATCRSFTVGDGKVTDQIGNTLGCRIYHGGEPAKSMPATHCVYAGPAGDQLSASSPMFCSGGDVCASFCALEIMACGSLDAPLAGDPTDGTGNPLFQYRNMSNCMTACAKFDKTHPYSTTATGDSLACRLYHATRAAISVMPNGAMHCAQTAAAPTDPCKGAAMP